MAERGRVLEAVLQVGSSAGSVPDAARAPVSIRVLGPQQQHQVIGSQGHLATQPSVGGREGAGHHGDYQC